MSHLRHSAARAHGWPTPARLPGAAALVAAFIAVPVAAQTIGEEVFRRDLERLTAAEMEGRAVGSEGGELAVRYLVERMDGIGLRPGVGDSFRQEFDVEDPAPVTFLPETRLTVVRGSGPRELTLGRDALPFRFSTDGKVEAEVVFAGYGLVIPELEWDDYRELDVRGKVVLVLRGAPAWRDADSPFRRHRRQLFFSAKAAEAERRGAAAMLLCERASEGDQDADIRMALRASGSTGLPALWLTRAAAGMLFDEGEATLRRLQQRLDSAAERHVKACGRGPTGASVRIAVHMGQRHPRLATSNVIGVLHGSDPERAREYVVVGAHHDHLGRGGYGSLAAPGEVGVIHPGADDNASGVAGLLALARRLKTGPPMPRSVVFVAFGAEEFGQHGSRVFLADGPYPAESIVTMVNLDMIGRARSGKFGVQGTGSGAGLQELVEREASRADLEVQVRTGSAPRSDHFSFLSRRIPALLFHTGLHEQYHRPTDVIGLVEVPGCLEVVGLAEGVIRGLSAMPEPPEFRRPKRH